MTLVRPQDAPELVTPPENRAAFGVTRTRLLSQAAGLTQFGAYWQDLAPGATTSDRHWHSAEDEIVLILTGTPTLIDDSGPRDLTPGDAVGWRAGVANAHHIRNLTDAPATLIIIGSRVARDICRYPDLGRTLTNTDTTWAVTEDASGKVLRSGELPPHLLNLPGQWGRTDAPPPPSLVRRGTARTQTATPEQQARLGRYAAELYSDTAGLTQFGAFAETLDPGARSSDRHWHEEEDEFLYMLSGTATLIEDDGPHPLAPGDACGWKAGVANGHQIHNRSDAPCT